MLGLPQKLVTAQTALANKKPVFSVTINDYEFPHKAIALRPDYLNWRCIWTGWNDEWSHRTWLDDTELQNWIVFGTAPSWNTGGYTLVSGKPTAWPCAWWAPSVCATKDGTLILWDKVTGYNRFPLATVGTDFTSWMAEQTAGAIEKNPGSYFPLPYCVVANPVNDEVIKFWTYGTQVAYEVSTNDGTTFSGTQYTDSMSFPLRIESCTPLWCRASYKENGDMALVVVTTDGFLRKDRGYLLYIKTRESGMWSSWSGGLEFSCTDGDICRYPTDTIDDQGRRTGIASMEIAHDGDWIIVYSWEVGIGNVTVKSSWMVYGDGDSIAKGVWFKGNGNINISTAYEKINSFSDVQPFSYSGFVNSSIASGGFAKYNGIEQMALSYKQMKVGWSYEDLKGADKLGLAISNSSFPFGYGQVEKVEYKPNIETNRLFQALYQSGGIQATKDIYGDYHVVSIEEVYPYSSLIKIPGGELMWCVQADDKMYFFRLRKDMKVREAIFYRAYSIESKFPMQLACSGDYVFGVSNYKIFMSVVPDEWTVPAAGTGLGATCTMPTNTRILNFNETVDDDKSGVFSIDFDNHDGYFDTPGTGDLANLKKGSRVSLYMGFKIGGTNTTYECRRYFVDSWAHLRKPNQSIFRLHCFDGWRLLDEYLISSDVMYNEFTEEYSSYEVIEKMVNSIGGNLYDDSCSTKIKNIYPFVQIAPNTTAGNVVRERLKDTGDVIRWFGNDAYLSCPATTDSAVYNFQFPKTS
jgi:hypothetical protein